MNLRIICSHDALKLAETLRRLLDAEDHSVEVSYGRHSFDAFQRAKRGSEVVLLIWSYEAPTTQYMIDWATQFDVARLVEIARAPGWPNTARTLPVIDYEKWNGERGGKAWNALTERLRTIARALEPVKPPPRRAAMALAAVSVLAIVGAFFLRVHDVLRSVTPTAAPEPIALQVDPKADGVGGPLEATEPPSADEIFVPIEAPAPVHVTMFEISPPVQLDMPELTLPVLRPPTLAERIGSLLPQRRDPEDASAKP